VAPGIAAEHVAADKMVAAVLNSACDVRGTPSVSIVVNNYNYGRYVADAIESALAQTHNACEVIVVDDGSTDDSRAVIAGFGERIVPIMKANGGQGSAMNAGFAASRGSVVIFLDADDSLLPHAVERALERMREPSVVKAHWPLLRTNASLRPTGGVIPPDPLVEGDLLEDVLRDGPVSSVSPPTSGIAWTRSFLERVLPMPEPAYRVGGDFYLYSLAPAFGRIAAIAEPLGLYRIHGSNNYLRMPLDERLRIGFAWFECQRRVLETRARELGRPVDTEAWYRTSYFHRLRAGIAALDGAVPAGATIALADEARWGMEELHGRRLIPFPEQDGLYAGVPASDDEAVAELARISEKHGARYLAVAWPAFWWLEHFPALARRVAGREWVVNEQVHLYEL
jgi:glycosyltransferase involved in cell wall biosynthesis